jgi:hypothetical protein
MPTFETCDIRHGSWIMARGKRYLDASDGTGRLTFRFDCSPEEAAGYFGSDDTVSARALFQSWKFLRDVIDNYRGGSTTKNRSRTDAYRPAWQER